MNSNLCTFREIALEDKEIIDGFIARYDKQLSIYNFANLFMWGHLHKYWWMIYMDRLVLYSDIDDCTIMPLGEALTTDDLLRLSDILQKQRRKGNFCFVPIQFAQEHKPELERYFTLKMDEDNADYIYSTQKLFELKGKKLHKKKNHLSQFQRENPDCLRQKLEPRFFGECIDLSEKWCKDKSCDIVAYAYETDALRRGFEYFEPLGLDGLVLLIREHVIAYAVFNRLNKNTALVHFEKYNRDIKGSGQAINWETAQYLMGEYEFLNREQDLGLKGLRQAKQSYEPDVWALTYRLIRKGT